MNYFEVLGVSRNATDKQIKNAYRKLVKKYHPDTYKGDKTFAEKKIKEINVAYDILENKEKRDALLAKYQQQNTTSNNSTVNYSSSYNKTSTNKNYQKSSSWSKYTNNYQNNRSKHSHTSSTTNSYYHTDKQHLSKTKLKAIVMIIIVTAILILLAFISFVRSISNMAFFSGIDVIILIIFLSFGIHSFYHKSKRR